MSREARAYLTVNLGGDRLLTRREMEKLLLYMGPLGDSDPTDGGPGDPGDPGDGAVTGQNREITLAHAQACVGDSAERTLDDLVFALGDRNLSEIERTLTRVFQEGVSWVTPLRAAAELEGKRGHAPGEVVCAHTLFAIASQRPPKRVKAR
jgi:DNA polymerase-3 subunit delta